MTGLESPRRDSYALGTSSAAIGAWVVGIVACVAGFIAVPDGFAGNVLAEAFGIAISVAVALSLVDRIARRERQREWAQVGSRTTRAIKRRIHGIAWEYWLTAQRNMPIEDEDVISGLALSQSEATISQTVTRLAESMRAILPWRSEDADPDDPEPFTESPESLHEVVADDFAYIKAVLTPRVVSLAADPTLVELLLRLEDHEEDWRSWMRTAQEWGAPDLYAWRQATAALEVAAEIFSYLVEPGGTLPAGDGGFETIPR